MSASSDAQQVFYSTVHPDRDEEFRASAAPKRVVKGGRKEAIMGCTHCGKPADEENSVKLKKCTGCSVVFYCSKECQRDNWANHKPNCNDAVGEGIQPLIKSITGNPMLSHYVQVCLALEFNLDRIHKIPASDRNKVIRAPLLAHIDVGIEPTKITDFMNLYTYPEEFDEEGMEGMLQLHDLVSPWPGIRERQRTLTDMQIEMWRTAREMADEVGDEDCAVVLVQYVNNFQQSITCTTVVGKEAVRSAQRAEPFVMCSAITKKEISKPLSVASCFEYINTHIRSDKKNQLFLRAPMRELDKELIRNLGRKVDSHATRALKVKKDREHVYISHSLDFVAGHVLNQASSRDAAPPTPLPENRQIEGNPDAEPPKMNRAERRRLQQEQKKEAKRRGK